MQVAIPIYEGFTALDAIGPYEVLSRMPEARVRWLGHEKRPYVTDRGVHVCPILIEEPDSVLAGTLEESVGKDYALRHAACYTCWLSGAICSNASSVAKE